jgi:myxalamid-type polyketide synthase MxaE and MxaD
MSSAPGGKGFGERPEPVAIVGIGCRFPGASGPGAFWRLLARGVSTVSEIPADRLDVKALYDPRPGVPGRMATRWGGFLEDVDRFDAGFFQMSPREAERLDPQQRLLLEVTWEALEDAGQVPSGLRGSRTGVFVGMWLGDWEARLLRDRDRVDFHMTTGSGRYAAAGRISQLLRAHGPSLVVDTACSSSLVAVHLACQSLWSEESDLTLAGGVNVILEPAITIAYSQSRMMAPDGRCKFGDARADGYVRSEGVGVVVLKPLGRALADGDRIYGVIVGSAVNNDGGTGGSFGTPGQAGQEDLLRTAYRRANVDGAGIHYVEVHGTGTAAGDPVELQALATVLGEGRPPGQPCVVGSVKTNIGHTEGAAGVAGLIKVALSLRHRLLPPSLHFDEPNPAIAWGTIPVQIRRELGPWPDIPGPLRAGVSSFGIAGTNAHVILEEAPISARPVQAEGRTRLLPVSARSPEALASLATALRDVMSAADPELQDLASTAALRREHHSHRLAVLADGREAVGERLEAFLRGESVPGLASGRVRSGSPPKVAFVFPGQGSQWLGMGRQLLAGEPSFRAALERCDDALRELSGWSVIEELAAPAEASRLSRIDVVQPVLFALQVSLAALWRSWGVEPAAVVGHSMGEIAAAHVAGALGLADAARIICRRSELMRRVSGQGGMAVVELGLDEARAALGGRENRLSVAVSNSYRSTVLSGDVAALDELLGELERRSVFCRRVNVDVASHSPHVEPLRADLLAALHGIVARPSSIPMMSTVTGELAAPGSLGPEYWMRNLREPVLFDAALGRLIASGIDAFIEMSPHPVLVAPVQEALHRAGVERGIVLASGRRGEDEDAVILESVATLWAEGCPVDWTRLFPEPGRVVSLPTYPWQRERFWYEAARRPGHQSRGGGHPLLGTHVALASEPGVHVWDGSIEVDAHPCLRQHGDGEFTGLPAAAWLEAVRAAAAEIGRETLALDDVQFPDALQCEAGGSALQLEIRPQPSGGLQVRALGRVDEASSWKTLLVGSLGEGPLQPSDTSAEPRVSDIAAMRSRMGELPFDLLESWRRSGHPPAVSRLWLGQGEGVARLEDAMNSEPCVLHPSALDAAFRVLAATVAGDPERAGDWRPLGLGRLRIAKSPADATWVYATAGGRTSEGATGDVRLLDDAGGLVLEMEGMRLAAPPPAPVESLIRRVEWTRRSRDEQATSRAPGCWILVCSSRGRVGPLAARLQAERQDVVIVDAFTSDDALARSLREALASGAPCRAVVHLGNLEVDPAESPLSARAAAASWRSALSTVQVLAQCTDSTAAPRLWLVTAGAQVATPGDVAGSISGAALWGFGGVVGHEYPALQCTRVDLPLTWSAADLIGLADEMLAGDDEDQIALRGSERRVARLVPDAKEAKDAPAPVRADGAYLISGGFGGLGLVVARWLVARGAQHLALFGRRGPSDHARRAIGELRDAGAEVIVCRGDVARGDDVRRILDELPAGVPLRGIVHAAGVFEARTLANLDAAGFTSVMDAKVEGALNLHAATLDRPLDFFAVFSSVAAVLGFPGVASYAAANAALDAVVARRRADGRPGLSIAWGRWTDVGMHATRGDGNHRLAMDGLGNLTPEEGTLALERALTGDSTHVLVTRLDVGRWARAYPNGARSLLRDLRMEEPATVTSGSVAARLLAIPHDSRLEALATWVGEQVGQVLRVATARVTPSEPFKAMGLDSLMSLELRHRIERALTIVLPVTAIWNYPTVAALASHLHERLDLGAPAEPAAPPSDSHDIEQILEEVEGLSEDEVQRIVAEDTA